MPRMVVVWCPDWPVVAAGAPPGSLTAVVHANRVVACSEAARAEGVRPGLRRREAQSRCPELELLAHDPARGAARYHGGEPALALTLTATVHAAITGRGGPPVDRGGPGDGRGGPPVDRGGPGDGRGGPPVDRGGCRVGIADGTFAAGLAARHQAIVPPGGSRAFLAPLPVAALDRPDLADLLVR